MDLCPQPEPTELDPDLQFPADAYYHLIHMLRGVIPPVSDAPADLTRRDNAVIAQVACLLPANADEANIAATYVASQARAMESMRLGRVYPGDPNFVLKCGMMAQTPQELHSLRRRKFPTFLHLGDVNGENHG